MATKKNRKQLEMHRTPPQPRRRSLFQTAGEVSKPFLITIITFVAILVLLILLLFSKQFVGRALYTGLEGTAGLEVGSVIEGQPFTAIVKANIGAEQTSTLGFTLNLPNGLSCDNVLNLEGLLLNALIETLKCENGQIDYTYATAGSPHTGEIKMVQIAFKPLAVGSYSLKFSKFDIIDAQNNIISLNVLDPAIDVLPKAVCGDGKVEGDEACDDGNQNDADDCTNTCNKKILCEPDKWYCVQFLRKQCDGTGTQYSSPLSCPDKGHLCGGSGKYDKYGNEFGTCVDYSGACGNGELNGIEACDDGNKESNDGCDEACQIENGWACSGEPSTCTKVQQCPPNLECCDGMTPVDFQTDYNNCGECGKICSNLEECKAGVCTLKSAAQPPATQSPSVQCSTDNDCTADKECKLGVCVAKSAVQPSVQCSTDNDCLSGYECKNNVCTIKSAAQLPGSEALPLSAETVQGKKVTLTEIAPANNVFSTLITSTEDFTSEVMVYTVLYGADNKVLSLQTEKIVGGLKKGSSYTATVNYLQSNVKKKTVLLYDVEANPQVHALLEKTYG